MKYQNNVTSVSQLIIIQMAMHMSVVAFVVMSFVMNQVPNGGSTEIPNQSLFLPLFSGLSLAVTLMVIFAPRFIKLKKDEENTKKSFNETADQIYVNLNEVKKSSSLFLDYSQITPTLKALTIMRLALSESIAVFGFVVSFLLKDSVLVIPFAVLALSLQIIFGPLIGKMKSCS